jgi:hypothetical protein
MAKYHHDQEHPCHRRGNRQRQRSSMLPRHAANSVANRMAKATKPQLSKLNNSFMGLIMKRGVIKSVQYSCWFRQ